MTKTRIGLVALAAAIGLALAACGGSDEAGPASTAAATAAAATEDGASTAAAESAEADLTGVKDYLLRHTELLTGFTAEFRELAGQYYDLAEEAGFDSTALWQASGAAIGPLVQELKDKWVEGNPYYERVEGIVAGTPSLSEYDVILDAGTSAAEDPEGAVPFDLPLADGTVLQQPGNFYNLTEGALWGTLPEDLGSVASTPIDLDGNGRTTFGEVLPDARFLLAAAEGFDRYANELADAAAAWRPADSDAFTALVVMVPTLNEYFGQWKESRFVAGDAATAQAFNVVSRLSDIKDILGGLEITYAGVEPLIATVNPAQSDQTSQELTDLKAFIEDIYSQEQSGERFTPDEADTLGTTAQDRATAVAGQISQAAAALGIEIEQ